MSKKVWLITGAGRGMGTDIAKAALAAGHAVVATGRCQDAVPVRRRPKRNPHRTGTARRLRTVAAILANPGYTGRQV